MKDGYIYGRNRPTEAEMLRMEIPRDPTPAGVEDND